jgi:NitT/TauT family transport system substrate-binding protein
VGASALASGSVDALSQFVAWPGQLAFEGKVTPLYDGAELNLPTFHGVTVRERFAEERPGILDDFLRAQRRATDHLRAHPVTAAESVAKATGLPAEVVYLYNGAHGIATFDPEPRPELIAALKEDVPVLKAAGLVRDVDVDAFVDPAPLKRAVTSPAYPVSAAAKPELWLKGAATTRTFDSPEELLKAVKGADEDKGGNEDKGAGVRAAYVPDALTGTRWFADKAVWVADGARLRAFVTRANAEKYAGTRPGARVIGYAEALERAS